MAPARLRLVALLLVVACDPGPIVFVEPGSGAGVTRAVFTVTATVDLADAGLADSLGWADGVPDADVHVLRNGTAEWITAHSDSSGKVVFEGLLPGLYRVYAGRTLTAAEAAAVGGVVRAFGDGRTLRVGTATQLELELFADRPGSLVISEFGNGIPVPWETNGSYRGGLYLEVYNNSDTTIYLDRKVFGSTHTFGSETAHTPCARSVAMRLNPNGVPALYALAFPGSGSDYPIEPGSVRVLAAAAIDHTPVHWSLLDLSDADFEIGGTSAANNPAVPDMLDVGLEPFSLACLLAQGRVHYLAEPVVLSDLPVQYRDVNGRIYVEVPQEKLLDVVAIENLWPSMDGLYPPCGVMIHRRFERYEGGFFEIGLAGEVDQYADQTMSVERRVLRETTSGRFVLMNTNTSAVDFFVGTRTPGWLPP